MSFSTTHQSTINPLIFREYDIRGLVDDDLSPPVLTALGAGFGRFLIGLDRPTERTGPHTAVVGHDARLTSPGYARALSAGLAAQGVAVTWIGEVPTPVLYFAVNTLHTDGGAAVTASHNPPQFNGLKVRKRGLVADGPGIPLASSELQDLRVLAAESTQMGTGGTPPAEKLDILDDYVSYVTTRVRQERPLKVVIDAGNGVAGPTCVRLLEALGNEVVPLYCDPDGSFPNHVPDPLKPENLADLQQKVIEVGADVGVALDGDGDRLGVVDNQGRILWPDQYLMILARGVLADGPQRIVFDVKCSLAFIEEIERLGGTPVMWRTGYPNIMAKRREQGAALAGEYSGHLFFNDPVIDFDDGSFAASQLLATLAAQPEPLSALVDRLPRYHSTAEERYFCADDAKFGVIERLRAHYEGRYPLVALDGIRVTFDGGWGLVRASNTEPALTTRFEAQTPERVQEIRAHMLNDLAQLPDVDLSRSGGH